MLKDRLFITSLSLILLLMQPITIYGATLDSLELYAGVERVLRGIEIEPSNRWEIELNDEEYEILAQIVMQECGNQEDEGQQAVVEVILNRIYSEEFPDTLLEVLSQPNQFNSYGAHTKCTPTQQVYDNIDLVLSGETDILPYKTMYFATNAHKGLDVEIIIGDHVFSNQKNYKLKKEKEKKNDTKNFSIN